MSTNVAFVVFVILFSMYVRVNFLFIKRSLLGF